jgi:hypothetical protein
MIKLADPYQFHDHEIYTIKFDSNCATLFIKNGDDVIFCLEVKNCFYFYFRSDHMQNVIDRIDFYNFSDLPINYRNIITLDAPYLKLEKLNFIVISPASGSEVFAACEDLVIT